jgi:hypothetical protein
MIQSHKIRKYQETLERENKDFLLTILFALEETNAISTHQKEAEKEIAWKNKIAVSKFINN